MFLIKYWLQSKLHKDSEWNGECWSTEISKVNKYLESCDFSHCYAVRIIMSLDQGPTTLIDYICNVDVISEESEFIDYIKRKYFEHNSFIDNLPWKESK
jgi:hypothetical protein